jgi:hypothetical protein
MTSKLLAATTLMVMISSPVIAADIARDFLSNWLPSGWAHYRTRDIHEVSLQMRGHLTCHASSAQSFPESPGFQFQG